MKFFRGVNTFLGVLLVVATFRANSQCYYPTWTACFPTCTYAVGDTVSYNGMDYECIATGWTYLAPGSGGGAGFSWSHIDSTCTAATTPKVASVPITGTYCRTSVANAYVYSNGGYAVSQRGIVYGTSNPPTLSDNVIIDSETSTGRYTGLMDDLSPETTYYVRGYGTNTLGTGYSTVSTFTTDADVDCADCALACDKSNDSLLDPATWPATITMEDTLCVTQDITIYDNVTLQGTIKICNDAQVTMEGSLQLEGANTGFEGQVIYEGCNEKLIGTGSYTGYRIADNSANDSAQMLSYCGSCDAGVQGQFLDNRLIIAWWAATCMPSLQALPVDLLSFTAVKHEEEVVLKWTTGTEINNNYFEVQTSIDGVTWFTIGVIQGAGNSNDPIDYEFIDDQPSGDVQYYRLKQVDFDNSYNYSNVRAIQWDETAQPSYVLAYDNGNGEIEVKLGINGMGDVILTDSRGRLISKKTFISVSKTGTNVKFNKSNLTKGIYFVNVVARNQHLSQKVSISK